MHPEDIKAAIRKRGYTLALVASRVDLGRPGRAPTKSAVSRVLRGDLKSARIAVCISQLIDVPVSTLWPGMYPAALDRRPAAKRRAA